MADLAGQLLMGSRQREPGLLGMIETPKRPAVRGVACRTASAEPTLVKVLVATFARGWRVLVGGRAVTLLARDRLVQPGQRKAREFVVEGDVLPPTQIVVALLAAFAELALMWVFSMAGDTTGAELVAIEITGVAAVTLGLGMRVAQRKLCLVVVEPRRFPFHLFMAGVALVAVASTMHVLQLVT